ncbi:PilZ domain-containing protein [Gellertiella hungarica]|uniref:PilZ domain-containing protein n=1 Tax=Gellertiella hungarica TaxID=1572859 RepID=A0A7W6J3J9_9HYPH|nr:PilZ domain-containing protein [Gellertiella hungarica]MBB4064156.1 hypothetical protein [Gellertiella hungarica]
MKEEGSNTSQVGNYLSRIRPQYERRRFERRKCNFMARVLFTAKGTREITQYIVLTQDISEVGVRLHTEFVKDIPKHFYLFVGKYQHGIGCIVVGREKDILRCEFIKEEQTKLVDFLARVSNPNQTLGLLKHPLFGFPPPH